MSKDSRLPSEFDLTPFVTCGKDNVVVAVVVKWSDATFIEDQDQWWMGGLHREVYLYSTAREAWLADVFAEGKLENDYTDGRLRLKVKTGFARQPEEGWQVEAQLLRSRGQKGRPQTVPSPRARRPVRRPGRACRRSSTNPSPGRSSGRRSCPTCTGSSSRCSTRKAARWNRARSTSASARWRCAGATARQRTAGIHPGRQPPRPPRHQRQGARPRNPAPGRVDDEAFQRQRRALLALSQRSLLARSVRRTRPLRHRRGQPGVARLLPPDVPRPALRVRRFWNARSAWSSATRTTRASSSGVWATRAAHGPNHDAMAGWIRAYDPSRPLHYEPGVIVQPASTSEPSEKPYDIGYRGHGHRLPDVPVHRRTS